MHYEMIIADNSEKNKRMAVLTAESLGSELVEMDCSGMRENVIIDLNEEGRRWEGGELNGKPFGFGREYSENDNLVYEGFVFEGMMMVITIVWYMKVVIVTMNDGVKVNRMIWMVMLILMVNG